MRIENMPIHEYHSHSAISNSKLTKINKSIFHYLNAKDEEKDHLVFGSALHDAVLLPDEFKKKYMMAPEDHDGRIVAGKALVRECKESGLTLVDFEDYNGILSVRERLLKNTLIRNMIEKAEKEVSYFGKIKAHAHEFDVRCRFDARLLGDAIDLKTTRSVIDQDIKWSIKKFRYYVQSPFYSDVFHSATGEKINNFIFVFIESKPPYEVKVKLLDRESEDLGRKHYLADLLTLKKYLDNPVDEITKIESIGLPSSSFYEETI